MSDDLTPEVRLERVLDNQRILGAFARIASEPLSRDRLMQHATALMSRAFHIRRVKILRYRADPGDLLIEAGVGWKPGVVGKVALTIDRASPPGRTLQTASPVIIEDLPNDEEFRYSPVLRDHGIVSVVNVPIMFDGRVWGVFEVDADQPRSFDEADVGFLTAFANLIGMAMQRQDAESRTTEALAENARAAERAEMLLRELQHRVKNNFQVILSFLALQRRHVETPDARERFGTVMDRVRAIALAHDQLSMREGGSEVQIGDYVRALCANIDPAREGITIEVVDGNATLPLDRAVPAGLIVNELVTNSLKYAFDQDVPGQIRVIIEQHPDLGEVCLTVEDDGKGMGPPRKGGLGLTLVEAFALQLGGRVERGTPERGTRTLTCFPMPL